MKPHLCDKGLFGEYLRLREQVECSGEATRGLNAEKIFSDLRGADPAPLEEDWLNMLGLR